MGDRIFVDTNILLRAFLTSMDNHLTIDARIKELLRDDAELWISNQVIREFIVQASHPKTLKVPLTIEEIITQIDTIKTLFQIAEDTVAVRDKLVELLKSYPTQGKQVHDANLVATMLVNSIETLFTLNIQDFKRFKDKITIITVENTP